MRFYVGKPFCIILMFFACSVSLLARDLDGINIKQIKQEDGLTDNVINHITQCADGYIWIATRYGLNRYDGYTLTQFTEHPGDSISIRGNEIRKIVQDPVEKKYLWIATDEGLCRFNKSTDRFTCYNSIPGKQYTLSSNSPHDMLFDSLNNLWITYKEPGLDVYIRQRDEIMHLPVDSTVQNGLYPSVNASLFIDSKQRMWAVHCGQGIQQLDIRNNQYTFYPFHFEDIASLIASVVEKSNGNFLLFYAFFSGNIAVEFDPETGESVLKTVDTKIQNDFFIYDVLKDQHGNIWLGTNTGGALYFDQNLKQLGALGFCTYSGTCLASDDVFTLFEDPKNNIWFGTHNAGLNVWFKEKFQFHDLIYTFQDQRSILTNVVEVFQDSKQNIWFGTDGKGLFVRPKNETNVFPASRKIPVTSCLVSDKILAMDEDEKGWLYFGQWGGVSRYHPATGRSEVLDLTRFEGANANRTFVWDVLCDSHNRLWVATIGSGLLMFDWESGNHRLFRHSVDDSCSISDDHIFGVEQDREGHVWIATAGHGLNLYNEDNKHFTRFSSGSGKHSALGNDKVNAVFFDAENGMWVSTANGLDYKAPGANRFRVYTKLDGLPTNNIQGVVEDLNANLWVTTVDGLAFFNRQNETFKVYNPEHGLLNTGYDYGNPCETHNGTIYIFGPQGANYFHPDSIQNPSSRPSLIFTGLRIYDRTVQVGDTIGGRVILSKNLNYTDHLVLDYTVNYFAIGFAALNFYAPKRIAYRYKLEGYDKNWIHVSANERVAAYSNLKPGNYELLVLASDVDGEWGSEPLSLWVTVLPPWWQTIWFKVVSVLLIGTMLLLLYWNRTRRLMANKKYLQQKLKEQQAEILKQNEELKIQNLETHEMARKLHDADQAKIRFFMNISHEFRTPLTLITGPLDNLLRKLPEEHEITGILKMINRNANRLLRLINQLLDLRKLETGTFVLHPTQGDIIRFVKDIYHSFEYLARRQNMEYSFFSNTDEYPTCFDADIVEKLMYNLISNALKYTPDGGKIHISVTIEQQPNEIKIVVADTGLGIAKHIRERIFDRFYTVPQSMRRRQGGTGIGLALVKEMAELHKGSIAVDSTEGEGSTFTLVLPGALESTQQTVKDASAEEEGDKGKYPHITENLSPDEIVLEQKTFDPDKKTILLIDDQEDILLYMKQTLANDFNLAYAANGEEGFQKTIQVLPDIVVSDVMMPVCDGIEYCKKLRSHLPISHIPVILLTAKSEKQTVIEGYETGADDYIFKPFDAEILHARIQNLIHRHQLLHKQYNADENMDAGMLARTDLDKQFLEEIVKQVEANMSQPEFSVLSMVDSMKIGRTTFYKKIKSITGMSANDFVKDIRLKHAAKLLKTTAMTVSEVSYEVGFQKPSYFSKIYREKYGKSPSSERTS